MNFLKSKIERIYFKLKLNLELFEVVQTHESFYQNSRRRFLSRDLKLDQFPHTTHADDVNKF